MKIQELTKSGFAFPSSQIGKVGFALGSVALGQWVLTDMIHLPGGGLSVVAVGAGIWWITKPQRNSFESPSSIKGWLDRCRKVIDQFEVLETGDKVFENKTQRFNELEKIVDRSEIQNLAFIGSCGADFCNKENLEYVFDSINPLKVSIEESLPKSDDSWIWPDRLNQKDLLIYMLPLPLRASDLLWLKKLPDQQPSWVMVSWPEDLSWKNQLNELKAQLPSRWARNILRVKNNKDDLPIVFSPVLKALRNPKLNFDRTSQRLLAKLHSSWQSDLEKLRRDKFFDIQQRTQWVVAGAVFASPVPSTDLISIAIVNGLMIQEMANIWDCSWKPDVLKVVARQLAGAALAQGIVEWSGQALLGVAKLHGSSWFAAGALQALSAAYLTRVVGRSMADWMALNNGVAECDLEALKAQAPQIVEKAAKEERVNWGAFLKQAAKWTNEMNLRESYSAEGLSAN